MRLIQILFALQYCPAVYHVNKTEFRPFETFSNVVKYRFGKLKRVSFQDLTRNPINVDEFTEMAEDTQLHNKNQRNIFLRVQSSTNKQNNLSSLYYSFTSLYYNATCNMPIYTMQTLYVNTSTQMKNWEYHCTIHVQGCNITGMHEAQRIPKELNDIATDFIVEGLRPVLYQKGLAPKYFADAFKFAWQDVHPKTSIRPKLNSATSGNKEIDKKLSSKSPAPEKDQHINSSIAQAQNQIEPSTSKDQGVINKTIPQPQNQTAFVTS